MSTPFHRCSSTNKKRVMEGSAAAYGAEEGGTAAKQAAVGGRRAQSSARETAEQHVTAGPVREAFLFLTSPSATWIDSLMF